MVIGVANGALAIHSGRNRHSTCASMTLPPTATEQVWQSHNSPTLDVHVGACISWSLGLQASFNSQYLPVQFIFKGQGVDEIREHDRTVGKSHKWPILLWVSLSCANLRLVDWLRIVLLVHHWVNIYLDKYSQGNHLNHSSRGCMHLEFHQIK